MEREVARQVEIFRRGVVDLIEQSELEERLTESLVQKRPLRIKFGMDPTSPDLHVGHAVPLMKLRALQELGHQIVLIVGDATAMVGDPSGRNKLRPPLSRAEIEHNLQTYVDQVGRVLDVKKTEVRRNSEWFDKMEFQDVLKLASRMTVARMVERDTFQKRMSENEPIGIHEFLYPLMQGWDSVMIRCDLELGGTDQLFNLLRGRDLQREESQPGQICFTTRLLNGSDGRKMSKSYGNAIAFNESATEMYRKLTEVPDDVLHDWFVTLTTLDLTEVEEILRGDRRAASLRLAAEITTFFHGVDAVQAAREDYEKRRAGGIPDDVPEADWPEPGAELPLMVLLARVGLASSSSEGRRLVEGGGVKIDGVVVKDPKAALSQPARSLVLQVGKNRFARVRGSR
ncbi:MAG: tyrosine--tRNA ligase [Planctomycetes bacterium]|nr:tyrosine--tRNA ligase [Planctomycetota bacterium]